MSGNYTIRVRNSIIIYRKDNITEIALDKIEKNLPKKPTYPIMENFLVLKSDNQYRIQVADTDGSTEISQQIPVIDYPTIPEQIYEARKKEGTNVVLLTLII